jgi:thiamine monophosphate synthase
VAVAAGGGLDYLLFGTVFATASKPGRAPAGLNALTDVVVAVSLPVLAVGGVTPDKVDEVVGAGAAGFAAIGMFAAAPRP